jgi:hypothetical protein
MLPFQAPAAGAAGVVALQYHFAGAANLADNTNFAVAKKILTLPSSADFQKLALDRLADTFWSGLQFDSAGDRALLRPLLEDLLRVESVASFGGASPGRLDFVLAARLDKSRAQGWERTVAVALQAKSEPFVDEGISGTRWNRTVDNAFWMFQARDWVVIGRGDGLASVRAQYLQELQKNGRPAPALNEAWFHAEVDWPQLAAWAPLSRSVFKLPRTTTDITASGGRFHVTSRVACAGVQHWEPRPWRIPKDLVHEPLVSFTAGQNVEPFLQSDQTLSALGISPFTNQFYCWALGQMPFQTFAAWPVQDGSAVLQRLSGQLPGTLNPILAAVDHSQVKWVPTLSQFIWNKSYLMSPSLGSARVAQGDFLLAGLFVPPKQNPPANASLWKQFEDRNDLVYYDWEFTGPRLQQWRVLSSLLPVLPAVPAHANPVARSPGAAQKTQPPLAIIDAWLGGMTPLLGNTVTVVTNAPGGQLIVDRSAQFLFTGVELVWLSHWLTDTPPGPVDLNLLPRAKISGPGIPRQ